MNRETEIALNGHAPLFAEARGDIDVSFEFFPPKTDAMAETLWRSIETLAPLKPALRVGHLWRRRIDPRADPRHGRADRPRDRAHAGRPPHLRRRDARGDRRRLRAAIGKPASATSSRCAAIRPRRASLMRRTLAAMPMPPSWWRGSKQVAPFEISVAAYPEVHPDSRLPRERSRQSARARSTPAPTGRSPNSSSRPTASCAFATGWPSGGRAIEIVPGILPVSNVATTRRFAGQCGAAIPDWMDRLFEGLDELPAARQLVAATIAGELCGQLYAGGVRHFHFYTLNRAELAYAICHLLGVRA